ncbi:MAG: hypothetical protein SFY80_17595 [Verrucomicrobiota bacterium]|nr:hypothetical protein [Verrucomicrobiota bacterium]
MIHINLDSITPIPDWIQNAKDLTQILKQKADGDRAEFINAKRVDTWGAPSLLESFRRVVGNKCWYSEVPLEGADPNIDHFRPKGDIREVDSQLQPTKVTTPGYWWLAFEYRNYRLTSMHANQRRVDEETEGGKWNFFPVRGARAQMLCEWGEIDEDTLALDPCSASDVALLWFDPYGTPCISQWRKNNITPEDRDRVRVTIWLYHLDKNEIKTKRAAYIEEIRKDLQKANTSYLLWQNTVPKNRMAKNSFDQKVAEIRVKLADNAPFAAAKRCAVRIAMAEYPWIDEFHII